MLLGVAVFGYLDKVAAATVTVLAGAIGMAFANLDKIELFKGAGFEARMRKAVEDAYATTDSLRSLALVMAEVVAGVLAVENRLHNPASSPPGTIVVEGSDGDSAAAGAADETVSSTFSGIYIL